MQGNCISEPTRMSAERLAGDCNFSPARYVTAMFRFINLARLR